MAVTLRDGTVIYADVFRPTGDEPVPAILVWGPYGKGGGFLANDAFPGAWTSIPPGRTGSTSSRARTPDTG